MSTPKMSDDPRFDRVIDGAGMTGTEMAEAIADAVGIQPGDTVQIVTPQFTRTPDMVPPGWRPEARGEWEWLRTQTVEQLRALGFGCWDGRLMLLPGEWHADIPEGFMVEDISGIVEPFTRALDDDIRYGCLAYGVPGVDGVAEEQ